MEGCDLLTFVGFPRYPSIWRKKNPRIIKTSILLGLYGKPTKVSKSQPFIVGRGFLSIKYFHTPWLWPNRGFFGVSGFIKARDGARDGENPRR